MVESKDHNAPLELLWAKSSTVGRPQSLPGHLLDTVAVAELIWDDFMAPGFKATVDAAGDGRGRDLFRLLAGWHDVGKASPPFQSKRLDLTTDLIAAFQLDGLDKLDSLAKGWHHTHAGRAILEDYLAAKDFPVNSYVI